MKKLIAPLALIGITLTLLYAADPAKTPHLSKADHWKAYDAALKKGLPKTAITHLEPSPGVNGADGIDRGDLAEVKGVINNGHEKVRGADDGLAVTQIIHGSVILGVVAYEQLRAGGGLAGHTQDFVQNLG